MTAVCRACGAALPDGAAFCRACGAVVGGAPEVAAPAPPPPPASPTGPAPPQWQAPSRPRPLRPRGGRHLPPALRLPPRRSGRPARAGSCPPRRRRPWRRRRAAPQGTRRGAARRRHRSGHRGGGRGGGVLLRLRDGSDDGGGKKTPAPVASASPSPAVGADGNEVVAAGWAHDVVGLRADGTAVAVGANRDGRCKVSSWRESGRGFGGEQSLRGPARRRHRGGGGQQRG